MDKLDAWHVAFLFHTFGTEYACFDKVAANPKLASLQINLINEPCHRNRRCGSYEFLAEIGSPKEYDRLLRAKDKQLHTRFKEYVAPLKEKLSTVPSAVSCLINPGLESNVSAQAGKTLIEWARSEFPRCRIIWNPNRVEGKEAAVTGAELMEGHGLSPAISGACIYNMDGTDISFPERPSRAGRGRAVDAPADLRTLIIDYAHRCELAYLWAWESNCLVSERTFTDPRKRDCSKTGDAYKLIVDEVARLQDIPRTPRPLEKPLKPEPLGEDN
jgi:hypothetical protein